MTINKISKMENGILIEIKYGDAGIMTNTEYV